MTGKWERQLTDQLCKLLLLPFGDDRTANDAGHDVAIRKKVDRKVGCKRKDWERDF